MTSAALCGACDTVLPEGSRFCLSCGTPVQETPVDDVRKTVTLLFCDVSGSTALGEQLDPEVLRSLMGEYFAVARAAVERHGGTVEKFVGDAVLAVFGIPLVREDDALRAVRAAAELRDGLQELAERLRTTSGVSLAVRTGVNTGAVVAGGARAGGSFATGDAVNTAARLEQAAPPGEVLLGAATWALVRDAVEVQPVEPLLVKGKAEPLAAVRLVRVLEVADGRARRAEAPLVGRERERRVLDEALDRVVADQRPQLVTVLGPAGIGKTRLLADFEAAVADRARVLRGRCLSYGRGITFWPVVSVLRQAAGLAGDEPQDVAREALRKVLAGLAEGEQVVERLAPVLGLGGEPGGADETAWAVRSLLEHLADDGPVVVVVDDLHWAEEALLDLLENVRDEARDVPLLLVCPARHELLEQRANWGGGAASAVTLTLEPLSGDHPGELLKGLLGGPVPEDVAAVVNRWADGNPLFLEEVVNHLLEEGLLAREDDTWSLCGDLTALRVPPTVTALLAARLDRLDAQERAVLEKVSVIGLEITPEEAASLADGAEVRAVLGSLARKGLLRRVRTARGEAFSFRHVLVREAAYDALPKVQRAALHERYADRLADHGQDTGAEADAFRGHHLEQAARLRQELSPNDPAARALAQRASGALAAAGEHARQADDHRAAEQLLERALALLPEEEDPRPLLLLLAWVRTERWQTSKARAAVDRALAACPPGPPDLLSLALRAELVALQLDASEVVDPAVVRAVTQEAVDRARAEGDDRVLCRVLGLQAMSYQMDARWSGVAALAQEMLLRGARGERRQARHRLMGAAVLGPMPFPEALRLLETAEEGPAESVGERAHRTGSLAFCLAALDRPQEAMEALAAARALLAEAGNLRSGVEGFMAPDVLLATGDSAGALEALRRGVADFRAGGGLSYASTLLGLLAVQLLEHGDDDAAREAIDEADSVTTPYDVISVALVKSVRGILAARQGRPDEAQRLVAEGLAVMDTSDALSPRADLYRWCAELPALRGDVVEQRRMLEEALRLYRQKDHRPFARLVEQQLAALS